MESITRKSDLNPLLDEAIQVFHGQGIDAFVLHMHQHILNKKIKFPLLEHSAKRMYEELPKQLHISTCTGIEKGKSIGGNVIIGMVLQKRLPHSFKQSIEKATHYISLADAWYVCDIIGERVFGYSLLTEPQKTIPVFMKLSDHSSNWVVRSLGAGGHYAIKKGLEKPYVDELFQLLLKMADTSDKEIRQGVGWAAKTTAKFHPDIIEKYTEQIEDEGAVKSWFRTKIRIGLNRYNYAKGN